MKAPSPDPVVPPGDDDRASIGVIELIDALLRGVGQVMLQNNRLAGALFLIGIFYNSALFGGAVVLGTTASTLTAILLAAKRADIRAGLFGFNGALVAIALFYFLQPGPLTLVYVTLAAACSTICMGALMQLLGTWKVPALTAPFVFITLLFILAGARFGHLHSTGVLPTAGLPKAATVEGVVTVSTVGEGLLKGVAQVFFQDSAVTGVIFLVGLLTSSRLACGAAIMGSIVGLLVGWGMGAAEPALRGGAFGFNCVLTAIAMGSTFFTLNKTALAYGALAILAAAVVFAAMSAALEPIGMPAMTGPFVLVVWLFVLGAPAFPQLRRKAT